MTIFIQDSKSEDVIYYIEDSNVVPNVGESVKIEDKWYKVKERTFYYDYLKSNSCTLWVEEDKL